MKNNKNLFQRIFSRNRNLPTKTKQSIWVENYMQNAMINSMMGLTNPAEGSATQRAFDSYNFRNRVPYLTFNTIDEMYRSSWMARRMIDVPASDMTRKWRKFLHENPSIIQKRELAEKKLNVSDTVRLAIQWADLYGGTAIIFGTDDEEDLSLPLKIKSMRQNSLKFLNVVFKDQINPSSSIELDPYSPHFQMPQYYTISGASQGLIHCSRLVVFYGNELPLYAALRQVGWGDSKLTNAWNILEIAEKTWLNVSQLISKATVDLMQIKDFTSLIAQTPDQLFQMLGFQKTMLSNYKTLVLDTEDKFSRNELGGLQGLANVMIQFLQMVAGAAGMPLTKFLGTSVGGFSVGDNEITQYYDTIAERQNRLHKQMEYLDRIIEMSTFGKLTEINYEWLPLSEIPEEQQAAIEVQRAQRDQTYLQSGIIDEQIIAKELQQNGTYQALDDEFVDALGEIPDDSLLEVDKNSDGSTQNKQP